MRIFASSLVMVLLLVPSFAFSSDEGSAKATFESRCSRCHGLERPLRKNKNRAGWQKTVNRMKKYAEGAITDDEAVRIIEYLTQTRGASE